MHVCTCRRAVAGGASPHTRSMSRSTGTIRPSASSSASIVRSRRPPIATGSPSRITSTGPSNRNSICTTKVGRWYRLMEIYRFGAMESPRWGIVVADQIHTV